MTTRTSTIRASQSPRLQVTAATASVSRRLPLRDRGRWDHAHGRRGRQLQRDCVVRRWTQGAPSTSRSPSGRRTPAVRAARSRMCSADADPNTGAAIYDSVSYFGQSGWFQVGGTSLASPPRRFRVRARRKQRRTASVLYSHQSLLTDIASGSERQLLAAVSLHRRRRLRRADRSRVPQWSGRLLGRPAGAGLRAECLAQLANGCAGRKRGLRDLGQHERRVRGQRQPERDRATGRGERELQPVRDDRAVDPHGEHACESRARQLPVHDLRHQWAHFRTPPRPHWSSRPPLQAISH